ncbi:trypsin-like serine peptidase [Streptomyces sp. NPDC014006]|uniref:trypsin-like serine peptidase n=1 Tax=Streptomyces sp. NPDC014006 TaxID=3364870 RepID=UPI0036F624A5
MPLRRGLSRFSATAALCTALLASVPPASAAPGAAADGWDAAAALRFWTPQRLASATDPSAPTPTSSARTGPAPRTAGAAAPRGARGVQGAGVAATHFDGIRSVGMLFQVDREMRAHYCSAATVLSPGGGLILTAGHCAGAKAVFVPRYDPAKPLDGQPYGVWPVSEWFLDPQYKRNTTAPESDLDVAFGRVAPEGERRLQDVAGGNTLVRTPRPDNDVTVVGYPSVGHNPQDRPVRCATRTGALPGFQQMRIDCAGMWGGVSGGPWFSHLDDKEGTGEIIGNVGGYNGGGPDVPSGDPLYDRITYSPLYGERILRLYDDAQNGRHDDPGPYQQPVPPFALGGTERWRQARLTAAGDFTAAVQDDLVVVWTDGSATLFQGSDGKDPSVPFVAQYQIAKPGSVWQHARAIAGGGFAAGGEGLVVRWGDGEVSQYTTVDRSGFHGEKMLTAKNATWQNAKLVTLGRFNGGPLRDDLLVVWASGTVSIYPDLGANALRKETQIAKSDKTWTYAGQIGTGDFTGGKSSDLMVRWIDGETTIYPAVDLKGLHGEKTIRPANSPWSNATVLTTGAFTQNKAANDVLVRWSDGRLTLHPNVNTAGLHEEYPLA